MDDLRPPEVAFDAADAFPAGRPRFLSVVATCSTDCLPLRPVVEPPLFAVLRGVLAFLGVRLAPVGELFLDDLGDRPPLV